MPSTTTDVLIVGGGIAGASLALRLADQARITLLTKSSLTEGSSLYAQGGVAAVLDPREDSFESHIEDTLNAGAGLCHRKTVEFVVRRGPAAIDWLVQQGAQFTAAEELNGPPFHLTREGGHRHRRVVHAADATGRAIETALIERLRAHPNVRLLDNHIAVDLITRRKLRRGRDNRCLGLYVLDKGRGRVETLAARLVVLATGGASKAYLYTSNPDTSTGDGIAMAWRAGCRVANMEFVQFHPTCLWHPHAKSFLITEAVRGEGGRLTLPNGRPFMQDHDARGELAPRDIVARAIDFEMKRGGLDSVHLDISHKPAEFIRSHFPTIHAKCLSLGYDMTRDPIPVVPAAHYTCGGIMTDLHGRTDLAGLYAIGECAFTGLHGANRLASNSLLACLVFAESAAEDIRQALAAGIKTSNELPRWDESRVTDADEQIVVSHNWDELRRAMWDYVGIVRTGKRLERARHRIAMLQEEIREYYSNFKISNDLIELRNLVTVAELIVRCAMARKESRGLHFTRDYPKPATRTPPRDTILNPATNAAAARRVSA
ncbi:MAG: L-aspartate oxidase [Pseudomonadota bacterium]